MERRHLTTYGMLESADPEVHIPKDIEELKQLIATAKAARRSVTFRSAGYSFDSQALNTDLVIILDQLNRIKNIDIENARITVEPGVRWGMIIQNLKPLGFTPHVVVTTEKATAGGAVAADCLSRSSPRYGKLGGHVERFQFLTLDGQLLECSPTQNKELFYAVIGGFGYLGALTEITFNLLPIGKRTQVKTVADKYKSFEELVETLKRHTKDPGDWDAIYSIAFFSGKNNKGFVFRSQYTEERNYKRLILYQPKLLIRIPIEWLLRFSVINNAILNLVYAFFIKEDEVYIDDLEGYTFFMDGNRRAKELAARFGRKLPTIQQTFIIPEQHLLDFLNQVSQRLREQHLSPNLFDILYVPEDSFLMSANNGLAGYAVSIAFEDLTAKHIVLLKQELAAISDRCLQLGGRVHLVKNVYATTEQLSTMYHHTRDRFLALKQECDPEGVLKNHFFTRIFGEV